MTLRPSGEVVELRCTWAPASRGGTSPGGRTVHGPIHWASAQHAIYAEVRRYDSLFSVEHPLEGDGEEGKSFLDHVNPKALEVLRGCKLEPAAAKLETGASLQFERLGYFCVDPDAGPAGEQVFNRTISLRDSWAKLEKKMKGGGGEKGKGGGKGGGKGQGKRKRDRKRKPEPAADS